LSELNAAYLSVQFDYSDKIYQNRMDTWNRYYQNLSNLMTDEFIELPFIPSDIKHNAHMFYIRLKDSNTRGRLNTFLKDKGITTASHYVPLHSSHAGNKLGEFVGDDDFTTIDSERLLRLHLYYDIKVKDVDYVISTIQNFFNTQFIYHCMFSYYWLFTPLLHFRRRHAHSCP